MVEVVVDAEIEGMLLPIGVVFEAGEGRSKGGHLGAKAGRDVIRVPGTGVVELMKVVVGANVEDVLLVADDILKGGEGTPQPSGDATPELRDVLCLPPGCRVLIEKMMDVLIDAEKEDVFLLQAIVEVPGEWASIDGGCCTGHPGVIHDAYVAGVLIGVELVDVLIGSFVEDVCGMRLIFVEACQRASQSGGHCTAHGACVHCRPGAEPVEDIHVLVQADVEDVLDASRAVAVGDERRPDGGTAAGGDGGDVLEGPGGRIGTGISLVDMPIGGFEDDVLLVLQGVFEAADGGGGCGRGCAGESGDVLHLPALGAVVVTEVNVLIGATVEDILLSGGGVFKA